MFLRDSEPAILIPTLRSATENVEEPKNIGKPSTRFVTPAYLASAVVALIFKNVPKATRLRTRFMRDPVAYDNVFSSTFPLEAWVALVSIFKRTDDVLATLVQRERTINNLRPLVSFLAVSRALKTYAFGPHDLIAPTMPNITDAEIRDAYLASCDPKFGVSLTGRVKASAVFACCIEWSLRYSVGQIEVVGKREIVPTPENHDKGEKPELSPELITKINDALPPQPWKPGVHGQIATKLGVSRPQVSAAINDLIARGVRNRQRNGVVFDSDGNIIAVDAARASAFGETGRTESNQENAGD